MSLPQSRKDLIKYCLRALGAPVLDINLEEEQIEDRIDEALAFYRDYHYDGIERHFLEHQITASEMKLASPAVGNFNRNDIIRGNTSNAEAHVYDISEDRLTIRFRTKTGTFQLNESITNTSTTGSATIASASTSITIGDVDLGYILLPENVMSITSMIKRKTTALGASAGSLFNFQYQWAMQNVFSMGSIDLTTYHIYKQYLSLFNTMFNQEKRIEFNRKTNKLHVIESTFLTAIDEYVLIDAVVAIDPETYKKTYSDEFLRDYATALLKRQWGTNLKKFNGITLPGGVTLNGQTIYDEAMSEIDKLQQRAKKEFQNPPLPFIA